MRNTPELWSDFDGTAVGIKGKIDPRNWTKYPLPVIDGYADFLKGFGDYGGRIAGIVSRRPDIAPRRLATHRSIAKLGLQAYFGDPSKVLLTGSETTKAAHVLGEAAHARVGLIDDKPHRVGAEMIESLSANHSTESTHITLGAVRHDKQEEYMDRLLSFAEQHPSVGSIEEWKGGPRYDIIVGESRLCLVGLKPYSRTAGQVFVEDVIYNGNFRERFANS